MAETKFAYNSYQVRKYDDIATDFPTNGVVITDVCLIGVDSTSGAEVTVQITLDSKEDIGSGDATWIDYETVTAGESTFISFDPAPNGVKLTGGVGSTAWIKS